MEVEIRQLSKRTEDLNTIFRNDQIQIWKIAFNYKVLKTKSFSIHSKNKNSFL